MFRIEIIGNGRLFTETNQRVVQRADLRVLNERTNEMFVSSRFSVYFDVK